LSEHHVIFYDGVCGLCDRLTRLVIRRDERHQFRFAPLQGAFATRILSRYGKDPRDLDTLYVIRGRGTPSESLLSRSDAVSFVLGELGGIWKWLGTVIRRLPPTWADGAYRLVARYRYRVFGRYDSCPVPEPWERDRFIAESGDERGVFVNS
jgi:predicted DCC family thiol-disulfide oxidoreductase YuxK